jgi:hypothetical protein
MKPAYVIGNGTFEALGTVPPTFDLPINDCPRGQCVSPVNNPRRFNLPCKAGRGWNGLSEQGLTDTKEFIIAVGLHLHRHFSVVCEHEHGKLYLALPHRPHRHHG